MSENCNGNCSSCGENCSSRKPDKESTNELSEVKKVVAVVSGKGGVGKSLVTGLLASESARRGYKTAVLDADVTGPSIPKLFGLKGNAAGDKGGILPMTSSNGVKVMSVNLLLEKETEPVVWRGPVIAGAVKQFWTDVIWDEVDYMFVDMPPGTGDVPLTVFQSLPIDGIIVVTSPQELASVIVAKAVNMAKMMNVPILGMVENMSYYVCPDCGKKIEIFGSSNAGKIAAEFSLPLLARIPVSPEIAALCDAGKVGEVKADIKGAADAVFALK